MGQFGFFGFLAEFGLLGLAVVRAASALRFVETERERVFLAALALILAINMIDLLPNSSLSPWTWLVAGALLGRAEALRALARQTAAALERKSRHGAQLGGPHGACCGYLPIDPAIALHVGQPAPRGPMGRERG